MLSLLNKNKQSAGRRLKWAKARNSRPPGIFFGKLS